MGFIVASGMLTLETQRNWWRPEPLDIGWHVAFWNLVVRAARRGRGPRGGRRPPSHGARRAHAQACVCVIHWSECRSRAGKCRHNTHTLKCPYRTTTRCVAAACAARRARLASGSAPSSGTLVRSTCAGASASPPSGVRAAGLPPCHPRAPGTHLQKGAHPDDASAAWRHACPRGRRLDTRCESGCGVRATGGPRAQGRGRSCWAPTCSCSRR